MTNWHRSGQRLFTTPTRRKSRLIGAQTLKRSLIKRALRAPILEVQAKTSQQRQ